MNVKITAKKMSVGANFPDYAEKKLTAKLDRFFGSDSDGKITVSHLKDNRLVLELTVKHNAYIFRAVSEAVEKEDALDSAIDKIIRQIRRNKTRLHKHLRDNAFDNYGVTEDAFDDEEPVDAIPVRTKKFVLQPMNVSEAILQMNLLHHKFFMFKNGDTGETNVVYRRDDNGYGLLEPQR